MATQLFLTPDLSEVLDPGGSMMLGATRSIMDGDSVGYVGSALNPGFLDLNRDAAPVDVLTRTSVGGPTNGLICSYWQSRPLTEGITISGTITFNLWASEGSMNANATLAVRVYRLGVGGAFALIASSTFTSELTTTMSAKNWTTTPTSTQCFVGDRIVVLVGFDDFGTMASGFTLTLDYGGASAGADGDSYITFTENLSLETGSTPVGAKFYLRDTPSDVSAGVQELEMTLASGSSNPSISKATNTQSNPSSPVQMTYGAGSSAIAWYTKPLSAFTLSGLMKSTIYFAESNAAANCVGILELALVDGDGTNELVLVQRQWYSEFDVTPLAFVFLMYLPSQAVTQGQRLRLRLFIDDDYDHAALMASGHTASVYYDGIPGTAEDSYIQLSQSPTELATEPGRPRSKVRSAELEYAG